MAEDPRYRCVMTGEFAPVVDCGCEHCVMRRYAADQEVKRLQEHWAEGEPAGPTATVPSPEDLFERHCRQFQLPVVLRQHAFARGRVFGKNGRTKQWRFDFAWPDYMLAVEIQGVVVRRIAGKVYTMGRHADVAGMRKDYEKLNAAILLGWSVLQFLQNDVAPKRAVTMTMRVLATRGWKLP